MQTCFHVSLLELAGTNVEEVVHYESGVSEAVVGRGVWFMMERGQS